VRVFDDGVTYGRTELLIQDHLLVIISLRLKSNQAMPFQDLVGLVRFWPILPSD